MNEQSDFDQKLYAKLWVEAGKFIEKNATPLEQDMLWEHSLLRDIVFTPYTACKKVFDPMVLVEGSGQGVAIVDFAEEVAQEAVNSGKAKRGSVFITTGAIGVRKEKYQDTGIVGANAEILAEMHGKKNESENKIIIESESLNTPEQAQKLRKIMDNNKFSNAVLIMSPWHAPRFYMTMVKEMPDIDFYSYFVWRDKNNISGATFDYGISRFQAPLLIAEIARLHKYTNKGSGPCSIKDLEKYMINLLEKNNIDPSGKIKLFKELVPLWEKNNEEILKQSEKYIEFRT